jgi:peroxiredoxin
MAQLRHDDEKFKALYTEMLVMVPNGPYMIKRYLDSNPSPFTILTDKGSKVASQYFQVKHFFAIGTPTVFVVDQNGKIAYAYYAKSPLEEPGNEEPLAVLAKLAEKKPMPSGNFIT